jgi:hypothetical protein
MTRKKSRSRPKRRLDTTAPGGDRTPAGRLKPGADPIGFRLETLPLSAILEYPDVQPREIIDPATVDAYAERMREGDQFPPVDVFGDGDEYILAEGYHRFRAAMAAKRKTIEARIHPGSTREAMLFAAGANATHGLPRSSADKRRVVQWFLRDPEWSEWSSNEIARRCGVGHKLVDTIRAEWSLAPGASDKKRKVRTKHGKTTTMKTGKIGKGKKKKPAAPAADRRAEHTVNANGDGNAQPAHPAAAEAAAATEGESMGELLTKADEFLRRAPAPGFPEMPEDLRRDLDDADPLDALDGPEMENMSVLDPRYPQAQAEERLNYNIAAPSRPPFRGNIRRSSRRSG